ncbi:MAG: tyrosine-protein phosphatase [Acidimicrobiales bacterium]
MFAAMGFTRSATDGLLSAPRWAMDTALRHLDEDHGGISTYLSAQAGMSPATLRALRADLVTATTLADPQS